MTQIEIEAIQAQRRQEHEAKMQVLHAQEVEIQKQKNILKAEFKAGNRLLESLKQSTPHSILNARKRVGYILRHKIGELLSEFACKKHYDTAQAVTNFNIEENGTMTISITIPPKQEQES